MRSREKLMNRFRLATRPAPLFALIFVLSLCAGEASFAQAPAEQAKPTYSVTVEHNVPAKMRDGITLRADIYRPKADGKFPVLLQRTPYDKTNAAGFGMRAAARGYVVVIQDVRSEELTSELQSPVHLVCRL